MTVGIGTDQFARNFGAIDWGGQRTKGVVHRSNIEATEMKQFQHLWIGE